MIEAIWPLFRNLYRRIRSYFEDEIELEMRQKEEAINIASETQILIDEIELGAHRIVCCGSARRLALPLFIINYIVGSFPFLDLSIPSLFYAILVLTEL
jgi:hypothetical protein